jgi:hypothetical protein
MGVSGKLPAELGRGLGEGPAGVERVVPFPQSDVGDEAEPSLVLGELAGEEALGVPPVEDVADVEDDGGRSFAAQPWRALKRRLVLLMT